MPGAGKSTVAELIRDQGFVLINMGDCMKEDPDIIKILREEERLGLLTGMSQGSLEKLQTPGEVLVDMPNESITMSKDRDSKSTTVDNLHFVIDVKKERKSRIDIVGDINWGTHLCQFYQTKEDLSRAIMKNENQLCRACLTGNYPLKSVKKLREIEESIANSRT